MCIKHLIPALVLLAMTAHAQADTVEYLHTDILGNVVAVTDENANVIERRVYEPYGLPETPIPDGPGFTGHDMDGETGLVYMQQRYYDPMVGRFLSTDPMAVDLTTAWNFNRYNYAANNPYRYTDPDGRHPLIVAVLIRCALNAACRAAAAALATATVHEAAKAIKATKAIIEDAAYLNESTKGSDSDSEATVSDRDPGPDGKRGSTGGPGAGKRFPPESEDVRASKEGAPCRYCGTPTTNEPGHPNSRERDHIDPKSRDGNNSPENEGDACRSCNRSKGARNPDEWEP